MGFKPRRVRTRVFTRGTGTGLEIPFDPREAFGKARAPVVITVGDHRYRTTTFTMGGTTFVPLSKANRDAAGVRAGQSVDITVALDDAPRVITPPANLARALRADPAAGEAWAKLSYSHQREHVQAIEDAVKPETRARRIERCLAMLTARR